MSVVERYRKVRVPALSGLEQVRARLEAAERRRVAQTAQQVAAGQLLLHDPEVRLAMGPEQEAEAYERLNELEASIGLPATPYADVPKQEFAKQIHAGQVTVAERALPAGERETLLDSLADATIVRFGTARVARYLVDLRNQQTLAQAATRQAQGESEAEVAEPPMGARQWVRSLIEPHAPAAVEEAALPSGQPTRAGERAELPSTGTPTRPTAPSSVSEQAQQPQSPARSVGAEQLPEPIAVSEAAAPATEPNVGETSTRVLRPDLGQIIQKRQVYLPIARNRMLTIVNPNASGKSKRAANAELLEEAFDLEPKEAARVAALPPSQQLAELKKMEVIEANADRSQSAWTEMITARMMPEAMDPKSPEGKALAQQAKQFAQDTWNYFRLTQPSAEAAKAAVQGQWTQYVAKARTYYANAGLPYDQDAVKRVLSLAGDTQAFEHAGATGKAPVGAGFVPPTDIVGARGLDPEFARRLANVQADMAKEGIEVRLKEGGRSGYRTHEDQVAMRGGKRGKWAAQGVSTHEVAHSYDLELYVKGVRVKPGAREWETLGRVATANGLYWGKNFATPGPEEWHVQLYPPGEDPDVSAANAAAKAQASKKAGGKGGAPAPKRRGEAEPTTSLAQSVAPPGVGAPSPGWGVTLTSAPSGGAPGAEPEEASQAEGPVRSVAPYGMPKPIAPSEPAAPATAPKVSGPATMLPRAKPFYFRGKRLVLPDEEILSIYREACNYYDVPLQLALAMGQQESEFKRKATSGKDARGIMQLRGAAATEMGVTDRYDPRQSIFGGVGYIAKQLKRFGNVDNALAAYNWGPTNVARHLGKGKDLGTAPKETRDYLRSIKRLRTEFWLLLSDREKDEQVARGRRGKK